MGAINYSESWGAGSYSSDLLNLIKIFENEGLARDPTQTNIEPKK